MTDPAASNPEDPVRRDSHEGDGASRGTARMEAFADAVFAIALTLPVVEIHIPEMKGSGSEVASGLYGLWPSYLGYAIAVLIIGLYWVQHHFSGAIYRTTGHFFLVATTVFLAAIGFIAFPARTFAESFVRPEEIADAARYLLFCLGFTHATWLLKWRVGRRTGHIDSRLQADYVDRLDRGYVAVALAFAGAILVSFIFWPAGIAIAFIALLSFLRPPETPRYIAESPVVESDA